MSKFSLSFSDEALDEASRLDESVRNRIRVAIEEKLVIDPETFGKPLRSILAGARSLRVGDWRIAYLVKGKVVYIVSIFHRSQGYSK